MALGSGELERWIYDAEYSPEPYASEARRRIASCPEVLPKSLFFWRAYHDLETERPLGMDVGPIPWRAIITYAQTYRLQTAEREVFVQVIRALDNRWRMIRDEKAAKKDKKARSLTKTGGVTIDSW